MTDYTKIYKNWDIDKENQKAEFIQYLYEQSGRDNGLYTGLWDEWCRACGEEQRDMHFDAVATLDRLLPRDRR
jgi:hypothetical protein